MDVITRSDAADQGLNHFFTGKPCKRGHLRERSVSTGACLGCLSHYAKQYHNKMKSRQRDAMLGISEVKVTIHPDDAAAIRAFSELLRGARIAGTPAPLVPPAAHVATVNTMIAMLEPAPSAPPAAAADLNAKHAMWVRIHGREIADQMLEQARG